MEPWIVSPFIAEVLAKEEIVIYNPTDISLLKVWKDKFHRQRLRRYLTGARRGMVLEPRTKFLINYGGINIDFGTNKISILENQFRKKAVKLMNGLLKEVDQSEIVIWCFTPYCGLIKEVFPDATVIFYIVDDFKSYSGTNKAQVEIANQRTVKTADYVVVVSSYLKELLSPFRDDIIIQHLGAPLTSKRIKITDAFIKRNQYDKKKKRKTIGMVGTFGDHVNFKLLNDLAASLDNYDFEFIGTIQDNLADDASALLAKPNVKHLGVVPYHEVLDFVATLDVCLLPFARNELTRASDPSKLYEYLACGKPVIATPINEDLLRYDDLIYVSDEVDFETTISNLDTTENEDLMVRRIDFIQRNTWSEVVNKVLTTINLN